MRLPSLSIEGDAVTTNSFYLHWTGLVAGVMWPVAVDTFFVVGRAFVRFVSTAALITSYLLGSAVCLNVAVALTDKTSPNLSVEIYLNYVGSGIEDVHSSTKEQIVPRFTAGQENFYVS